MKILRIIVGGCFLAVLCYCASGCAKHALESAQPEASAPMMQRSAQTSPATSKGFIGESKAAPRQPGVLPPQAAGERMIHHNGYMKLRTPRPQELLDKAGKIVIDRGGYVEQMDNSRAVFRIPVAVFDETFRQLLTLGDVLDKSLTTEDITDAFLDVDLRLSIAKTTRERLVALLAKAKTEKEKLKLLQEIQRVSEQIEVLTGQREALLVKARFSTITVEVAGYQVDSTRRFDQDLEAFRWIHQLSPFEQAVAQAAKSLKLGVPKEMVALDRKQLWIAESADGAVIWACRRENQPKGDTDFWAQAIALRLKELFQTGWTAQSGGFKVLQFKERSEKPYIYWIGVRVGKDNDLDLVEVYFPIQQHEKRYSAAVRAVIEKGGK